MDINEDWLVWFINFLIKRPQAQNEQLAEELHKPNIRKFKKRKVYSAFKDNMWGADLADMQLISKFNKGFNFLLCVIVIIFLVNMLGLFF